MMKLIKFVFVGAIALALISYALDGSNSTSSNAGTAAKYKSTDGMVHVCNTGTQYQMHVELAASPRPDCDTLTRDQYNALRAQMFLAGAGRGPDPSDVTLP